MTKSFLSSINKKEERDKMLVLNLLEKLLRTHKYFSGEKIFKIQALLLYFYKKNIEEFIEGRKRLIAEEKEKTGVEVRSPLLEETEEFLKKINQVLEESPEINEIVQELEKKNFIIQIMKSMESEKHKP